MKKYRNRIPKVIPFKAGIWRFVKGLSLSEDKKKLVPKYFYKAATKEAVEKWRDQVTKDWENIVQGWDLHYKPLCTDGYSTTPHWISVTTREPPPELIGGSKEEFLDETEFNSYTYNNLTADYFQWLDQKVSSKDVKLSTAVQIKKTIDAILDTKANGTTLRNLSVSATDKSHILNLKTNLNGKKPRYIKNLLINLKRMLKWLYDERKGFEPFPQFNDSFLIRDTLNTDVDFYTAKQLIDLLKTLEEKWIYPCVLLALNCGMYSTDIAALTHESIDGDIVTWQRQKELENKFIIKSKLWPETIAAINKFKSTDKLLFTKDGNPLNFTKANGKTVDHIGVYMRHHAKDFVFKSFRKSSNQLLLEMDCPYEYSELFLGHKLKGLNAVYGKAQWQKLHNWTDKLRTQFFTK